MIQNTKNTKSLILRIIITLLFGAFFGGVLSVIFGDISGILSFEIAFWSFVGVFASVFMGIKPKLQTALDSQHPNNDEEDKQINKKIAFGLSLSFSLLRLVAYVLLVLALIGLLEWQCFDLYCYMAGLFVSLILIVGHLGLEMYKR
ncbi:hypothetical protein BBW65_02210 [Helicobacter enhydrae]|uniref:Uncharacterized protein n=1 Tax=Helicobacter enhydrae TaxID=222136 RepID=A0A1B1U4L6_9HELI|nr:hypothetical protein [Helicobacter enhydrae]ANV97689.1 hypothetical protein BBW65_02210 [Helicobacter enhydrae]